MMTKPLKNGGSDGGFDFRQFFFRRTKNFLQTEAKLLEKKIKSQLNQSQSAESLWLLLTRPPPRGVLKSPFPILMIGERRTLTNSTSVDGARKLKGPM